MKSSNFFITLSEPLIFSRVLLIVFEPGYIYKKPRGNVGFIGGVKGVKKNTEKI
jgi:hypothetical protein